MRLFRRCFLFLCISTFCIHFASAATCLGEQSVRSNSVYLIPRLPVTTLYQDWAPILKRLGKENGLCFDLHIPVDFTEFEQAIRAGKPDFVLLNPYHQVMVARKPGYVPLVRDQQFKLAGVLVVRKDSSVQDIHQLEGATVAFPAPNAYAASLLMRALLAKKNIHITADYVGSHNNVYRAVALGAVQAGGGVNTTLSHEPVALQSQLRVLFTTPNYMPHPFSAHPRISLRVQEKVITGFLNIATDSAGQNMLKAIQMAQPIRANYARDYKELEGLKLEQLVVPGGD
ncbi:MAG: phosphate/phosphite/phosphonate ABC transporter substrate-binding protein [Gallionella sp.]|nr:phosphate/phosphite/phosphonate ABC transporter substrate-binding protein [Gallionella sp.]MDD4959368.1 phosphate/phosphite/phosphonate ABC transporter substrate-binding protein [Gallionella sp.]